MPDTTDGFTPYNHKCKGTDVKLIIKLFDVTSDTGHILIYVRGCGLT